MPALTAASEITAKNPGLELGVPAALHTVRLGPPQCPQHCWAAALPRMRFLPLLLLALQDCNCAALPRDPRQIIRSRIVHSEQEVENIDREYLSYLQECFVFFG